MTQFKKSIITLSLVLISANTLAAGFQLNTQSAAGLGRAFAGDAVIADNASAMARNAATMTLFKSTELSLGAIVIDTDVSLKNNQYTYFNGGGYSTIALDNVEDISGINVAPNIFIVHPVSEQLTVGVGMYSNFATTTEYDQSFAADLFGGTTKVRSVNLQLSGAYRLSEQWSIGGGFDVIYGQGELYREYKAAGLNEDAPLLDVEADGITFGWHVGAMWELNPNHRFGLSYRYSPMLEADGDFTFQGAKVNNDTLNLPLPSMAEFSGFHQLTATTAVHYSAQFIEWSKFDSLDTDTVGIFKQYDWQNVWHFAVGATHQLNQKWTIRTGYMYDLGAVDQIKSITIPDSDRQWFSAGFTYQIDTNNSVDFGFTYLLGKDTRVTEQQFVGPMLVAKIDATTRANATLFGLEFNHKF
ncbi:MAG: outer membrane protein transport protein [Gammaproteobacteria bacterium]|nr:outer membrane protein transport protein [Gammaproteobacteria bacterium]